ATLAAMLKPLMGENVNMVSAPVIAKQRDLKVAETRKDRQGAYEGYVRLIVTTEKQTRSVAGTVYSDGHPRIIQIKGVNLEAEPYRNMLYTTNTDQPGFVGELGTALGSEGVNIATFAMGRDAQGGEAITLIGLDSALTEPQLRKVRACAAVRQAKLVAFAA
ncbi:MAG: phosphoglycerate dehydrogenase, partial [Pseudomonadota bacterium]